MAAATLWRGNCDTNPQRYLYNDAEEYPGEYDIHDMHYRLDDLAGAVDAVTLRPGYRVTLYSQDGWKGVEETIHGAYETNGQRE